jgi:NAD(P)-dependent dehydrogenase (short-subunit alcohol dehydrogenase family)
MLRNVNQRVAALLERWARAVELYWTPGEGLAGCYGPGYIHWGVQSNWNYAAAVATLASLIGAGTDVDLWRGRALSALRFALATHCTGSGTGHDGRQWGHTWISMLGIERGMHGVPLLAELLTPADHEALRRVLTSEADWLLHDARRGDERGVVAGLWNESGRNVPESNIWSGALLWRAAQLYPDAPGAAAWADRAHDYLINGISVPADAESDAVVAGKPVRERFVGANFFPNYALDHHGYLNAGYMAICTSNAAMLTFDMRRAGLPVPDSLAHHQGDMWAVLRRMIFANGRLARIGGDSRVRYAYCQEYLLPALLFAADTLGDPHALALAERQLALIEEEMAASGDGTFYGRRMGAMRDSNPHYYTRLESDRAVVLSMLVNYLPLVTQLPEPESSFEASVAGGWAEPEHGACLHRSPRRLASFAWRSRGLTTALCLPPGDPVAVSSAEWARNLAPVIRFLGDTDTDEGSHRRLIRHTIDTFPGGFATCGSVMEGVDTRIDEGAHCTDQALTYLAFAALPDDRTCVGLQLVIAAPDRIGYLVEAKGLHLNIANDLFNGFRRTMYDAGGTRHLLAPPARDEVLRLEGRWLNVDEVLGLVLLHGAGPLLVHRAHERRGGRYRSLYVEEVCVPAPSAHRDRCAEPRTAECPWRTEPGEILLDTSFALLSGATAAETAAVAGGALDLEAAMARGVWVTGADGRRYAVIANFGEEPFVASALGERFEVEAGDCRVLAESSLRRAISPFSPSGVPCPYETTSQEAYSMHPTALVTGADRGLGFGLTEGLLQRGYRVFAGQYMPDWPELDGLTSAYPERLHIVSLDVGDTESCYAAAATVGEMADTLDVLINNAGITGGRGEIGEGLDYEAMQRAYNVNALGAIRVLEAFLPLTRGGPSGAGLRRLCFVSSEAGSIANSYRTNGFGYYMSKAAVNMAVKITFNRLRPKGYTFRLYHPGWVRGYMSGTKGTRADLEPDVAAEYALPFFLNDRDDEDRLVLIDNLGREWPF